MPFNNFPGWMYHSDNEASLPIEESTPRSAPEVAAPVKRGIAALETVVECYLCSNACKTALSCERYAIPLCRNCTERLDNGAKTVKYGEISCF